MRKNEMTKRGFLFACSVFTTGSGCRFRREVSVTLPSGMNEQKEIQQSGDVELSMNSDENLNKDNGNDSNSEPIYLESMKLKRQYRFKSVCSAIIRGTNDRGSRAVQAETFLGGLLL